MKEKESSLPCVKCINGCSPSNCCIQDPDDVSECVLPNAEFKFMHKVYDQHPMRIETKCSQFVGEGILASY